MHTGPPAAHRQRAGGGGTRESRPDRSRRRSLPGRRLRRVPSIDRTPTVRIRLRQCGIGTRPRLPLEQLQAFANLIQMGHPCPRKPSNAKACNTPAHREARTIGPILLVGVPQSLNQLCVSVRASSGGPISPAYSRVAIGPGWAAPPNPTRSSNSSTRWSGIRARAEGSLGPGRT
jgi:hypothetical protein